MKCSVNGVFVAYRGVDAVVLTMAGELWWSVGGVCRRGTVSVSDSWDGDVTTVFNETIIIRRNYFYN